MGNECVSPHIGHSMSNIYFVFFLRAVTHLLPHGLNEQRKSIFPPEKSNMLILCSAIFSHSGQKYTAELL